MKSSLNLEWCAEIRRANDVLLRSLKTCQIKENDSLPIRLCCQETWLFQLPHDFVNEHSEKYIFIHESVMDPSVAKKGRAPTWWIIYYILKKYSIPIMLYKRTLSFS